MDILKLEELKADHFPGSVVTIGNFDGVHLGHRAIFRRVLDLARSHAVPSVAITFEPHPREVLNTGTRVPDIMPFKERCRLIAGLGIEVLVWVEFTLMFAARSAGEFMSELEAKLHPRLVVIGHDFRFGRGRQGDEAFLRARGQDYGYAVEVVEGVEVDGELVSSSRIRELIAAGDMEKAGRLLGRPFSMEGRVIKGRGRGKPLGFATANLSWEAQLIPRDGVYAALAYLNDHPRPAVVNIGTNPTFADAELSVEAHLLDYQGDLYEQSMRLVFIKRLRDEARFASPRDLAAQIEKDVAQARNILSSSLNPQPPNLEPSARAKEKG